MLIVWNYSLSDTKKKEKRSKNPTTLQFLQLHTTANKNCSLSAVKFTGSSAQPSFGGAALASGREVELSLVQNIQRVIQVLVLFVLIQAVRLCVLFASPSRCPQHESVLLQEFRVRHPGKNEGENLLRIAGMLFQTWRTLWCLHGGIEDPLGWIPLPTDVDRLHHSAGLQLAEYVAPLKQACLPRGVRLDTADVLWLGLAQSVQQTVQGDLQGWQIKNTLFSNWLF